MHKSNLIEYKTWNSIKTRCTNQNTICYPDYGGRGISVCDRWKNSFENFLEDMGAKPDPTYSIDRIDNDKGYSPDNCRWTDRVSQNTNQRMRKDNTSGYVGVYLHEGRWTAAISSNKKRKFLGYFKCKHKAAMVYDMYKEKHGIHPYKQRQKQ